jgi:hypothetical protein
MGEQAGMATFERWKISLRGAANDPNYANKLDFAYSLLTNRKETICG